MAKESSRLPQIERTRIPLPGSLRTSKTVISRLVRPSATSFIRPPQQSAKTTHQPTSSAGLIFRTFSSDGLSKHSNVIQKPNPNNLASNNKTANIKKMKKSPSLECHKMIIDETLDLVDFDDGFGSNKNLAMATKSPQCNETITLNANGNVTYEIHKNIENEDSSHEVGQCLNNRKATNSTFTIDDLGVHNLNEILKYRKSTESHNDEEQDSPTHRNSTRVICLSDVSRNSTAMDFSPITQDKVFNSTMAKANLLVDISSNNQLFHAGDFLHSLNSVTNLLCLSATDNDKTLTNNHFYDHADGVSGKSSSLTKPEKCTSNEQLQQFQGSMEKIPSDMQKAKQRFSLGLDLTECIADCSIDLCDISISSSQLVKSPNNNIQKQNSFEMDESLGILTPDQMKEFLDSVTTTNTNPNIEMPLCQADNGSRNLKLAHHQCRIDLTPSPEELPLDPIAVKTDFSEAMSNATVELNSQIMYHQEISQSDSDPKTEMSKSATSKVSASIITSITSITSLDTGYQGDGEMDSRPASRGADQSPTNCPRFKMISNNLHWNGAAVPIHRTRQEPLTDSDFFTESDADDHRGERRCAQVIDGQLFGPMMQSGEKIYIHDHPHTEDSCGDMESSGVFTDIDNRCDEDIMHRVDIINTKNNQNDSDMSPDTSTDTIGTTCSQSKIIQNLTSQSKSSQIITNNNNCTSTGSMKNNIEQREDNVLILSDASSFTSCKSASADFSIDKTSPSSNKSHNNVKTNTTKFTTNSSNSSPSSVSSKKLNSSRKNVKNETNLHLKKHELSNRGSANCKAIAKNPKLLKTKSPTPDNGITIAINSSNDNIFVVGGGGGDNQENKRPTLHSRKVSPNKWNAVMNKIAENKIVTKKSLHEVQSKVLCGVAKRCTAFSKTSSTDEHSSSSNMSSRRAVQQSTSKRNRAHSKDSQQSSASDLSLISTSPKLHKKTTSATRTVKKRDVRTISSTPNDIGQTLPKTVETNKVKLAIVTQKRITQNVAPLPVQELKSSPPTKKSASKKLISQIVTANKSPLKDQNRLVNKGSVTSSSLKLQQNDQPSTPNSSNASTPPHQQHLPPTLNRDGTIVLDSPSQSIKLSQSPLDANCTNNNNNNNLNNKNTITNKTKNGNAKSTSASTKAVFDYTTSQIKVKPSSNQQQLQLRHRSSPKAQQHQQQNAEQSAIELQNAIVKDLRDNLSHANKGAEALGVLVQYLVYHLDAFSCPLLKSTLLTTTNSLLETKYLYDEAQSTCQSLERQLVEKEAYFHVCESELKDMHREELQKVQTKLIDLETTTADRISLLEIELRRKNEELEEQLKACNDDAEAKLLAKNQEIEAAKNHEANLLERIACLSATENELREKVHTSELEYSERLQMAAMRERELNDVINVLRKQTEETKSKSDIKERELEEKLNLSQDEIVVLRHCRNSPEQHNRTTVHPSQAQILQDEVESLRCVLELKQSEISELRKQNQELVKSSDELTQALVKISALESRIEDVDVQLKAKLEEEKDMIQKQKQLQESYSQEVKNRNRLSLHNEELQWRLKQNSEKFSIALTELSKSYHDTSGLMNTSIRSINSQDMDASIMMKTSLDKSLECFVMEDVSPPSSPVIKGVVEKSDSVSWVLEMDDESPEALASRMVRRAGSFRASVNDKIYMQSPVLKRQRSQGNNGAGGGGGVEQAAAIFRQSSEPGHSRCLETTPRIRSKSVSVKIEPSNKLVRSNSNSGQPPHETVQQIPSRNIEDTPSSWNKACPVYSSSPLINKMTDNNGTNIESRYFNEEPADQVMDENEESCGLRRYRTTSFDANSQEEFLSQSVKTTTADFHRDKTPNFRKTRANRGLITCDTKALTSKSTFERRCADQMNDIMCRSLPIMQTQKRTVNENKKPRRPKMAAGEAMVSGSNSEDESLSSDDFQLSSRSSSSSCTSSNSLARRQLSMEDVLLQKIVASFSGCSAEDEVATTNDDLLLIDECCNETPMNVSWSEDGEPSESIV